MYRPLPDLTFVEGKDALEWARCTPAKLKGSAIDQVFASVDQSNKVLT